MPHCVSCRSQTKKGELEYQIHASYVEIYSHRVYDLLAPDQSAGPPGGRTAGTISPSSHNLPELALKETWDGEWLVVGATSERVCSSTGQPHSQLLFRGCTHTCALKAAALLLTGGSPVY